MRYIILAVSLVFLSGCGVMGAVSSVAGIASSMLTPDSPSTDESINTDLSVDVNTGHKEQAGVKVVSSSNDTETTTTNAEVINNSGIDGDVVAFLLVLLLIFNSMLRYFSNRSKERTKASMVSIRPADLTAILRARR